MARAVNVIMEVKDSYGEYRSFDINNMGLVKHEHLIDF
jgi:hypothetical protein